MTITQLWHVSMTVKYTFCNTAKSYFRTTKEREFVCYLTYYRTS